MKLSNGITRWNHPRGIIRQCQIYCFSCRLHNKYVFAKIQDDADTVEAIRDSVFERERSMSTGVGKGLAIPHCKTKSVDKNYAAFARLESPLDFNSIDNEPVQIIFLLVGPDSNHSQHIKLLSRISRLMNSASFHEKILSSNTSEVIIEAFQEEEEKYFVH